MQTHLQPIDGVELPRLLKTNTSIQEWCGHVFEQWNQDGAEWQMQGFSYFQSAGDQRQSFEQHWLEDEMWTRLRLDPQQLPTGGIRVIPGAVFRRFHHKPATVVAANAQWDQPSAGLKRYRLYYPSLDYEISWTLNNFLIVWSPGMNGSANRSPEP